MTEQKQDDIWVICPKCKIKLKQNHISTHMKHVHKKILDESSETLIQTTIPKKRKDRKPLRSISKAIIGLIIIIIVVVAASTFAYFTTNPKESNNNSNDTDPNVAPWMKNYIPIYDVGTGSNNFWIKFPVGNPSVGQSVEHLTWITEDLKEKPVVFVVHKTGCAACTPQADRVKAFREIYGEDAVFYDLDIPLGGDIEKKAYETFYYDPNGEPNYIALTGVFTLINEGGVVKIGWHSWEGNVADATMENWIKDAIYYYNINSEKK